MSIDKTGIPAKKIAKGSILWSARSRKLSKKIISRDKAVELYIKVNKTNKVQLSKRRRPASFILSDNRRWVKRKLVKAVSAGYSTRQSLWVKTWYDQVYSMKETSCKMIRFHLTDTLATMRQVSLQKRLKTSRIPSDFVRPWNRKRLTDVMNILMNHLMKWVGLSGRTVNCEEATIVCDFDAEALPIESTGWLQ